MSARTNVRTIKRVQNIRPLYQYLDNKIKENAFRYSQANFKNMYYLFHSQKNFRSRSLPWGVFENISKILSKSLANKDRQVQSVNRMKLSRFQLPPELHITD